MSCIEDVVSGVDIASFSDLLDSQALLLLGEVGLYAALKPVVFRLISSNRLVLHRWFVPARRFDASFVVIVLESSMITAVAILSTCFFWIVYSVGLAHSSLQSDITPLTLLWLFHLTRVFFIYIVLILLLFFFRFFFRFFLSPEGHLQNLVWLTFFSILLFRQILRVIVALAVRVGHDCFTRVFIFLTSTTLLDNDLGRADLSDRVFLPLTVVPCVASCTLVWTTIFERLSRRLLKVTGHAQIEAELIIMPILLDSPIVELAWNAHGVLSQL